jgi:hypothetical protein
MLKIIKNTTSNLCSDRRAGHHDRVVLHNNYLTTSHVQTSALGFGENEKRQKTFYFTRIIK